MSIFVSWLAKFLHYFWLPKPNLLTKAGKIIINIWFTESIRKVGIVSVITCIYFLFIFFLNQHTF